MPLPTAWRWASLRRSLSGPGDFKQPAARESRRLRGTVLAVLLAGVAATAVIVALLTSTAAERDRQAFEGSARSAQDAITDRVETSIALLRGTAGLLASQGSAVTVDSFAAYMGQVALREQYPGLLGIGFSRRVRPAERERVESELRAQGHVQFRIWPEDERPELHAIVYLEPLDERNRAAIGYDMFTNAIRRSAMERARDSGSASASGVVELVQEIDQDKQPGFLIYLPVYEGGAVPASVAQRRERLLGYVYAPIRAVDFLSSAFSHAAAPSLALAVYHGSEPHPAAMLYQYVPAGFSGERFRTSSTIRVAGEPWTFVFRSRASLVQSMAMPLLTGLAGVALSALLALLLWREAMARTIVQGALESERAARSQAERANIMKDQFLATLSHELRTPLHAIVGWAAVLKQGRLPETEVRHGIEVMDRNAQAQARLIDDLLDMNRITSGKLRIELQPVDAAKVLDEALGSIAPAADNRGVRIEKAVGAGPLLVRGDPARLQQIAWNLLSNAIKFTPRGGEVRVALERASGHLRLSVADTGEGIEPHFLDHIFYRFAQADGSITRRYGGLGLGLAIVRELVDLHGGTVCAASPGKGMGATFVVELPLLLEAQADTEAARPAADTASSLEGVQVLVVDDEHDACELVRVVLEERRAEVQCVSSGEEALEALGRRWPDVLLSDIGMPGMNGYELMRRVRAMRQNGEPLPAAALTAYAREQDRRAALAAGFAAHIVKPVRPEELVAVVSMLAPARAARAANKKGARRRPFHA